MGRIARFAAQFAAPLSRQKTAVIRTDMQKTAAFYAVSQKTAAIRADVQKTAASCVLKRIMTARMVVLFVMLLSAAACENEFSPKAEFHEKIVVFSILDPAQEFQSVLLFRSYDAQLGVELQPLTPREVSEADVRMTGAGEVFIFRDTVITVEDGGERHVWINRDLHPRIERKYRLEVRVPGEDLVSAETTVPSRMYVRAERVIPDTGKGLVRVHHGVSSFTAPPEGFYFRAWVETWKRLPSGDTLKPRIEIPIYYNSVQEQWVYTKPSREEEVLFAPRVIEDIKARNESPSDSVLARRMYLQGYCMDSQFYTYYKMVRGFDDPVSVRLDRPDVSFIDGGLGVFGALVPDSSSSSLYSYIGF